ncbi:MAG: CDP-alcohol phosphatidyltransferase family protein [Thermoplasmatota archaeon]
MDKNKNLSYADLITLTNALLGFLAITYIIDGMLMISSILLLLCILLDGADGWVARRLNVEHELGAYLDVFSDMVSLCFAPALLLYTTFYDIGLGRAWEHPINGLATFIPSVIVFFGTLRLSRFADVNSKNFEYSGIPTPIIALLIIISSYLFGWGDIFGSRPYILLISLFFLSFFLYSTIKYPKIRDEKWIASGLIVIFLTLTGFIVSDISKILSGYLLVIPLVLSLMYVFIGPLLVNKDE